jgi:hypothetical protein
MFARRDEHREVFKGPRASLSAWSMCRSDNDARSQTKAIVPRPTLKNRKYDFRFDEK